MARSKGSSRKKTTNKGKGTYRSAISGRYVTSKHGKSSPKTTIKESTEAREFSSEFNERYRETLIDLSKR